MAMSHASCSHESTSKARAACRKSSVTTPNERRVTRARAKAKQPQNVIPDSYVDDLMLMSAWAMFDFCPTCAVAAGRPCMKRDRDNDRVWVEKKRPHASRRKLTRPVDPNRHAAVVKALLSRIQSNGYASAVVHAPAQEIDYRSSKVFSIAEDGFMDCKEYSGSEYSVYLHDIDSLEMM